jgi:hypothetical protein
MDAFIKKYKYKMDITPERTSFFFDEIENKYIIINK